MFNDKQPLIDSLSYYLSIATIVGLIVLVIWVLLLIYSFVTKKECKLFSFIHRYALPFGFLGTLGAASLTLFYSDYLGVLPCGLCWFQRVALYPQIFLYALALYKKDYKIFSYTLILSIFGEIVALYHSFLQWGYSEFIPCPVVASTVDCAKPSFMEFGFISFPFMSFVLFGFLILLSLTVSLKNRK